MSRRPPDKRTILFYLALGLVLVAAVSVLLGNEGWLRVLRLLVIYGSVFLLVTYILGRARRKG